MPGGWSVDLEPLAQGVLHGHAVDGVDTGSFAGMLAALRTDSRARSALTHALAAAPFVAYRWECPPVTSVTVDRPFEFVLLESPRLVRRPDQHTFSRYFSDSSVVVEFPSLARDAVLLVPCPLDVDPASYVHLAAFLREAPEAQVHELWMRVGDAMQERVNRRPVWLSTAGGGVAWLHVRLDDHPKYYAYPPYRSPTA